MVPNQHDLDEEAGAMLDEEAGERKSGSLLLEMAWW